jgi:hypothetical protein
MLSAFLTNRAQLETGEAAPAAGSEHQPDPPTPHRPATPVNLLVRGTCQANDTSSRRPAMKPRG